MAYGPDRNLMKCLVGGDQNDEDKVWLPLEVFVELLDRQRDSLVVTKFSRSAEAAMIQNNTDMMEAFWCRVMSMLSTCGWCTLVSYTTRGINYGITQSFITVLQTRFS